MQELTGRDGKDLIPERDMDNLELARWMALILEKAADQQAAVEAQGVALLEKG